MPKVMLVKVTEYDNSGYDYTDIVREASSLTDGFLEISEEDLDILKTYLHVLERKEGCSYKVVEDYTPTIPSKITCLKKYVEEIKKKEEEKLKKKKEADEKREKTKKEKDIAKAKKLLEKWGEDGKSN